MTARAETGASAECGALMAVLFRNDHPRRIDQLIDYFGERRWEHAHHALTIAPRGTT